MHAVNRSTSWELPNWFGEEERQDDLRTLGPNDLHHQALGAVGGEDYLGIID